MIKRGRFDIVLLFALVILTSTFISASSQCKLETSLISQDPYPVTPGENVKLVFQVTGVDNKECGEIRFRVVEDFPFTVDPSLSPTKSMQAGIFTRDYPKFWTVPYTLRVNKDAKEGENELSIVLSKSGDVDGLIRKFNINVKNVQTEFEVFVRDYNQIDKILTLEIINVGKNDVESLVIEIPNQENLNVRGSNKQTIGILDSNEDTTTRFRISDVKEGEIELIIRYNDLINERRDVSKSLYFNPDLFKTDEVNDKLGISTYIIVLIIIALIIYWRYKKQQRRKNLKEKRKRI